MALNSLVKSAREHAKAQKNEEIKLRKARIVVVGVGGAGNNTVTRLMTIGIEGAECIAMNTDMEHLNKLTKAHKKFLLGPRVTGGLGAGGDPNVGAMAAQESEKEIADLLKDADIIFIAAGMGGGTGTGASPVIARIGRSLGAIVVGVVTLPFKAERGRMIPAKKGLKMLRENADTVVVIDNQKLLELVPDLPLEDAFSVADEILANMVKALTETIAIPSMINLDLADVKSVLKGGGVAAIGIGEAEGEPGSDRVERAVQAALQNPLVEFDISTATRVLVHVTGPPDMDLKEATKPPELITSMIKNPDIPVIWGARIDPTLENTVRVIIIVTGVSSSQILGPTAKISTPTGEKVEEDIQTMLEKLTTLGIKKI